VIVSEDSDRVVIDGVHLKPPKVMTLTGPNRLVFDFEDDGAHMPQTVQRKETSVASAVRYAFNNETPPYTRVVFDVTDWPQYVVAAQERSVRITVMPNQNPYHYICGKLSFDSVALSGLAQDGQQVSFAVSKPLRAQTVLVDDDFVEAIVCEENKVTVTLQPSVTAGISGSQLILANDTGPALLPPKQYDKPRIVIDPGHGGKEPGVVAYDKDGGVMLAEKECNLAISLLVYDALRAAGADVYLTRDSDASLELADRVQIANQLEADLFISIHNNAIENNPGIAGTMVLYQPNHLHEAESKRVAGIILDAIVSETGETDRGVRAQNLYVLRNSPVPAVLIECAFFTNPDDLANLMDPAFIQKMADAIALGILRAVE